MDAKVLAVKHCGTESKVALSAALPFQCGGNASCGASEKHDQKKASSEGIPCLNNEPKRVLASE
jgi:hypothetical protein